MQLFNSLNDFVVTAPCFAKFFAKGCKTNRVLLQNLSFGATKLLSSVNEVERLVKHLCDVE